MKTLRTVLSVILFIAVSACLISAGLYVGLRYGALKGNSVSEIMDNSGAYDAVDEATKQFLLVAAGDDEFKVGIIECIPDNMISKVSKATIDSLSSGKDIDLRSSIEDTDIFAANVTNYIIDKSYDELDDNTMISAQTVYSVPYINEASQYVGMDMAGTIVAVLKLDDTPVNAKDVITPEVVQQTKDFIGGPAALIIASQLGQHIDSINNKFNTMLRQNEEISRLYLLFEKINSSLNLSIYVLIALLAGALILSSITFIVYAGNSRGAFRLTSSYFIFSAVILGIISGVLKAVQVYGKKIITAKFDFKMDQTFEFIRGFVNDMIIPVLICAGIYLIIGIVLRIVSSKSENY